MGKWLKILAAAVSVAPELIHVGKQVVATVKGKTPPADPPQLGQQANTNQTTGTFVG